MLEAPLGFRLTATSQFVVAVAPTLDAVWVEKILLERIRRQVTIRIATHATYDALGHCDVALVASGTATIEAALSRAADGGGLPVFRGSPG